MLSFPTESEAHFNRGNSITAKFKPRRWETAFNYATNERGTSGQSLFIFAGADSDIVHRDSPKP
jgi:hypothetical protein